MHFPRPTCARRASRSWREPDRHGQWPATRSDQHLSGRAGAARLQVIRRAASSPSLSARARTRAAGSRPTTGALDESGGYKPRPGVTGAARHAVVGCGSGSDAWLAPRRTESHECRTLAGKIAVVTGVPWHRSGHRSKLAGAGCDLAVTYYNTPRGGDALRRDPRLAAGPGAPDQRRDPAMWPRPSRPAPAVRARGHPGEQRRQRVLKPTLQLSLKHWRWCLETNALPESPASRRCR